MKLKRLLAFLLIIILLGLLSVFWPQLTGQSVSNSPNEYTRETALVTRVIDGDTIVARSGDILYTYRLLGINTPEKNKPYYIEAKNFLKQVENKSIEILRDKEDTDKYDRKLRYVFYKDQLINSEIIQNGFATTFMLEGLKYETKLKNAEIFAKNNSIGLWKRSNDICSECIILKELNPEEEFFIIRNICSFDCKLDKWLVKDDANHFFMLKDLHGEAQETYTSEIKVWNDEGDRFFMRDNSGDLVVFYEY